MSSAHGIEATGCRATPRPAVYELIPAQRNESFRWHRHDYPAPLACWNYHPEYELHLIAHGSGRAMIGDHIGAFGPRQLVLIGPDLPHAWFSPLAEGEVLEGRDIVLQFSRPWIEGLIALCPELHGLSRLLDESLHGLEFIEDRALRLGMELEDLGMQQGGARLAACIGLLTRLAECPYRKLAIRRDDACNASPDRHRMQKLIRKLLSSDPAEIRHEELAASVGMSPSAFSRQFRATTGETLMNFLQKLRVSHACQLLTATNEAITDICRASGFSNISNFNRIFLKLRGCTPRDFRRQSRQISQPRHAFPPGGTQCQGELHAL